MNHKHYFVLVPVVAVVVVLGVVGLVGVAVVLSEVVVSIHGCGEGVHRNSICTHPVCSFGLGVASPQRRFLFSSRWSQRWGAALRAIQTPAVAGDAAERALARAARAASSARAARETPAVAGTVLVSGAVAACAVLEMQGSPTSQQKQGLIGVAAGAGLRKAGPPV